MVAGFFRSLKRCTVSQVCLSVRKCENFFRQEKTLAASIFVFLTQKKRLFFVKKLDPTSWSTKNLKFTKISTVPHPGKKFQKTVDFTLEASRNRYKIGHFIFRRFFCESIYTPTFHELSQKLFLAYQFICTFSALMTLQHH